MEQLNPNQEILALPYLVAIPIFPHEIRVFSIQKVIQDALRNAWLSCDDLLIAGTIRPDPKGVNIGKDVMSEIATLCRVSYYIKPFNLEDLIEIPREKISALNTIDRVSLTGLSRARIIDHDFSTGKTRLKVRPIPEEKTGFHKEKVQVVKDKLRRFFRLQYMDEAYTEFLKTISIEEEGLFCDTVAIHLGLRNLSREDGQRLLSAINPERRLFILEEILNRELTRLEQFVSVEDVKISGRGEPEEPTLQIPKQAQEEISKIKARVSQKDTHPSERESYRNWLNWVQKLPWGKRTKDNEDMKSVRKVLDETHYDIDKVKERILEYFAVRKLAKQKAKPSVICLVGPPGVGKTSVAKAIAKALNRKFFTVPLGARTNTTELSGSLKVWIGAEPGEIIKGFVRAQSKNPVILLDEIDKAQSIPNSRGSITSFLLSLLDPEQNKEFTDNYLSIPFDVSESLFITSANTLSNLPKVLLDRLEVIEMSSYSLKAKLHIAKDFLYPKQITAHGLEETKVTIEGEVFEKLVRSYKYRTGIRALERAIEEICRKIAKKVVEGQTAEEFRITTKSIDQYLERGLEERTIDTSQAVVGTVLGLVRTDYGGEVLAVEATALPGQGGVKVTGLAGKVIEESAKVAYSYLKKNAGSLGIEEQFDLSAYDFHVHLPEAGIAKDGPSAGLAIFLALFSAATNTPVRHDIAMTGEINLEGEVMGVGALPDKLQAARNVGIARVIVPKDNRSEANSFLQQQGAKVELYAVDRIEQVMPLVFQKKLPSEMISSRDNSSSTELG